MVRIHVGQPLFSFRQLFLFPVHFVAADVRRLKLKPAERIGDCSRRRPHYRNWLPFLALPEQLFGLARLLLAR
jgi:hypothetical protein